MLKARKKLYRAFWQYWGRSYTRRFDNAEGKEEVIPDFDNIECTDETKSDIFTMLNSEVMPDVMTVQKMRKVLVFDCGLLNVPVFQERIHLD